MSDTKTAKNLLYEKKLTLVIVKDELVLFQTDSPRISGFIKAIDTKKADLKGASVADRVVGKAVALLCVYAGIKEVYAEVLSVKAKGTFEQNHIAYGFGEIVDNILDLNKVGVCPFEKLAATIVDPKEAYAKFSELLKKMRSC
jgi:hypothetical protein